MQRKRIFDKLAICALVIFSSAVSISQAYRIPEASQELQQHNPDYRHYRPQSQQGAGRPLQRKDLLAARESNHGHAPALHHQHEEEKHYSNDLHLSLLAEAAKDPRNLKNGIYHDGAITYDLGLPNYKILNLFEPPEVITSDHPLYHAHLKRLKSTNKFAIEDLDFEPLPEDRDPGLETTSAASSRATAITDTNSIIATTATIPDITTAEATQAEARKNRLLLMPRSPAASSAEILDEDLKFAENLYGQSVLLPA